MQSTLTLTMLNLYTYYILLLKQCTSRSAGLKSGSTLFSIATRTQYKQIGCGFILTLFQRTTANQIDSEHTPVQVCKVEILQVTGNKIEVKSSF